jgi:hypothetical protein
LVRKICYNELHEISYIDNTGKVAAGWGGGKHYRRSSEKAYKSEHDILEKAKYMSTPSPTIPSVQSPWIAFLQEGQAYTYIGLNNDVH